MKVLYLYSELGPYNMPVFKELANKHMANLWVVSWSKGKIKPYRPEAIENVQYFDRSKFRVGELMSFSKSLEPDLVYVSGWMDKGYLSVARLLTKLGVPVVCGMDGIWRGGVRQLARAASFPLLYRGCFSHAWVAGMRQYEYAKRIGFPNDRIRFDLLTCDYQLFSKAALELNKKKAYYPRRFLYVGNFRHVKGTDILVKAYSRYRTVCKSDPWDLICIGNGELQYLLEKKKGIEVRPFASQATLVSFCDQVGAFVLPSRRDHWGVVVHEFAAAGLPLLTSKNVGANAAFVIPGFNGINFESNSVDSLTKALINVSEMSTERLISMGINSTVLAGRITPQTSAANFVSVLMD